MMEYAQHIIWTRTIKFSYLMFCKKLQLKILCHLSISILSQIHALKEEMLNAS